MKKIRVVALLGILFAGCQSGDGEGAAAESLMSPTSTAPGPGATAPGTSNSSSAPEPSTSDAVVNPPAPNSTTPVIQPTGAPPTPMMTTTPPPVNTPAMPVTNPDPSLGAGGTPGTAGAPATGGTGVGGAGVGGSRPSGGAPAVAGAGGAPQGDAGAAVTPVEDPGAEYFSDWPDGTDPATIGLELARLFDSQASDGTKHYKEACAWYGAMQIAVLLNDTELLASLTERYAPYKTSYASLLAGSGSVDENVWGIVPLEISLHDEDPVYLEDGVAIADHQQQHISTQIRNAIDDMFMITGLQMQAYRATADAKYLDLGAETMASYIGNLQQDDGLFFQLTPSDSTKWSRGNGWFATGMAELLRELPTDHASYAVVRAGYDKMMAALLDTRVASGEGAGLWKQVLDYDGQENWAETSGSAMFTVALITGVRNGWLDAATYGPVARDAWIALVGYLESDGRLRGVSDWMYGGTIQEYTSRPTVTGDNHGQAPMLWSAAALLR